MKRTGFQRLSFTVIILSAMVILGACSTSGGERSASATPGPGPEPVTGQGPGPARPANGPTNLALLIGINDYQNATAVSPLAGSINDVDDMLQVLTTKFEFPRENIKVLKNSEATHAAIIDAIRNFLIANAKPGDHVLLHYSGHGSQMKDVTGKQISGLDETIVPYDSRDPRGKVFDISGAELHGLLRQLLKKTPNVTFVLDSCHSGTLVRDIARVRAIPADTRTPPPLPSYGEATTRGLGVEDSGPQLKYVVIAAATSKESAYEYVGEGKERGALTYFLARQLRAAKPDATYRDVMDEVIANVTANFPQQHPQVEGVEADQRVFGDASIAARPYVLASPLDAKRATLEVGQVEGATVGSIYEVYAPGSKMFVPPDQPVAKVQITTVGASSSEANLISGNKIPVASRAVEREHQYASATVRVYLKGVDASPVLQSIRNALQALKYVQIVNSPSACHLQLREVEGKLQTLGADLSTLSPPLDASDSASVSREVERVKEWARFFNILAIRNSGATIDVQFALNGDKAGGSAPDPMGRLGKPDMGVTEGQTVVATLQNKSERDLYIAILDLSDNGSIAIVYPAVQGAQEVLKPGSTLTRRFKTFLPKGSSRVMDILKVFASYQPIDLTPLTQGAIRSADISTGPPDPLQDLLGDSTGTRSIHAGAARLDSWTTTQKVLVVVKRKG